MTAVLTVDVVDRAERARALLHPTRTELLSLLDEPRSAATLARELHQPRQRINYHLRELEQAALVELVEERRRGSCHERLYRRSGRRYALSAGLLGGLAARPEQVEDQFSSAYQVALASRAVEELSTLQRGADRAGKRLATFSMQSAVRFRSAAERAAFAEELTEAVARLVEKYHGGDTDGTGAEFRLYLGAYPKPHEAADPAGEGSPAG